MEEVQNMGGKDIWETVDSAEWVSPLVTVDNGNGKVRIATDITKLNEQVIQETLHPKDQGHLRGHDRSEGIL